MLPSYVKYECKECRYVFIKVENDTLTASDLWIKCPACDTKSVEVIARSLSPMFDLTLKEKMFNAIARLKTKKNP